MARRLPAEAIYPLAMSELYEFARYGLPAIPEDYEFVAFRPVKKGESYLAPQTRDIYKTAVAIPYPKAVVRHTTPRAVFD